MYCTNATNAISPAFCSEGILKKCLLWDGGVGRTSLLCKKKIYDPFTAFLRLKVYEKLLAQVSHMMTSVGPKDMAWQPHYEVNV